jgi:NADPH:quinone reductase-like Zn-dependent oxidoreductase
MPHSLTIKKIDGKPGAVYYPLQLNTVPQPSPGPKQLLVRLHAAALNHRDLFIRQQLYPGISFDAPLLADGAGTVAALGDGCGPAAAALLHRRVILTPTRGWARDRPLGPDSPAFSAVGAAAPCPGLGMAQDWIVVGEDEVEPCPPHLAANDAVALPLAGLTAWRALVTKSGAAATPGSNVLVTGIGGGVALAALQFGAALGLNVYVTSSDPAKVERALRLGARGGVSYRDPAWDKDLAKQLPASRPYLDAVIDGAGGDIVRRSVRLLKPGGVISIYGMTVGPQMDWLMSAVLRNIELRGSTMGSRSEFADMVRFVAEHEIVPVVSRVVKGLDNTEAIDGLFAEMRDGKQFGKLVIEISDEKEAANAKL